MSGVPAYEELLSWPGGQVVATARTRLTRRIEIGGRGYYLKTQRFPRRPRYFLRPSAYVREARAYRRMADLDIRVPEVAAVGQRRSFGFLRDALLLTAEVPGSVDLARWAEAGRKPRDGLPPFDAIRSELVETVERAHRAGYRFGDLKPRNLLAAPPDGEGRRLVVLDQRRFHRCPFRLHSRRRDWRFLADVGPGRRG